MNYEKIIAQSVQQIKPSGIRKYFDYIGDEYISLGVGEPDFATPMSIRSEALKRLSTGRIPYTSNAGIAELRERISAYLTERFDIPEYAVDEVLITVGASQAIDLAIRATVEQGDEVICPEPTYVSYAPAVMLCGGTTKLIVTDQEHNFKITPEALKAAITPKTKAIILPFPNNPTGGIMEKSDLEAIANVIRNTNILVIADEIYAELTYNGKTHVSMASLPGMRERTIILNGFSKAFSMTGWRLGFAAGPFELISAMTKVHQLTMLCAPTTAQVAGIVALEQGKENGWQEIKYMVDEYDKRRKFLVRSFNELGLKCNEPEGAFYVFPSISSTGMISDEFCTRLVEQKKVVAVPGDAFGNAGEGYIRCCYATDYEKLEQAIERIEAFLRTLS